jgi:hypothetical protein
MFSWISLARRSLLYTRPVSRPGGDSELRVEDALNAGHAAKATAVTRNEAAGHRSGTAISQLVAGCTAGGTAGC